MTEETNEVRIHHLEKEVEGNTKHIEIINGTINGVKVALERISYTLEKIERLEKENAGLKSEVVELRKEIQSIKSFNNKILGAVLVVVFIIEIASKFLF